jgi:hypothetical protein
MHEQRGSDLIGLVLLRQTLHGAWPVHEKLPSDSAVGGGSKLLRQQLPFLNTNKINFYMKKLDFSPSPGVQVYPKNSFGGLGLRSISYRLGNKYFSRIRTLKNSTKIENFANSQTM